MSDKSEPKKTTTASQVESAIASEDGSVDPTLTVVVNPDVPTGVTPLANGTQIMGGTDSELDSESVQIVDASIVSAGEVVTPARRSPLGMSLEILKLFLIPLLILAAFAIGIVLLGVAQRFDWIESTSAVSDTGDVGMTSEESNGSWICPMMCVPPTNKPGRCPVCAMELVPASKSSSSGPSSKIEIDPRSRRVAGIKTTVAQLRTLSREINSVGEIKYDETRQKTLSAYIDGRIEELKADYTGVEVKRGESLGRLYSPDLYSAQVEYLRTLEYNEKSKTSNARVRDSNQRLSNSARQRLIELGLTEPQIKRLESERTPNRVLDLYAPISGTVVEKMATVGQYIQAGAPIYRLADLSQVWLVLELFPEDAKAIRLGQTVNATSQSLGNESLEGTVEFIEPTVDPKTRTVGVRVSINNEQGSLKPGEFAQAVLTVPLSDSGEPRDTVVIPRNSLLSIGKTSLAYVETKPGEFQLRKINTGPTVDGMVAVFEGIAAGENVVSKSTFLLDAQMQLQGNPSLIDPDKATADQASIADSTAAEKEEIRVALAPLSDTDRALALEQEICPVTEVRLGTLGMGTPIKLQVKGRTVFICCEGCRDSWVSNPDKYDKILADYHSEISDADPGQKSIIDQPLSTEGQLPQTEIPQNNLPDMEPPQ